LISWCESRPTASCTKGLTSAKTWSSTRRSGVAEVAAFCARGVLRARLRALLPEPGSETTGSGGSLPFERELLRTVFIKVYAM
jgi:hypothetical protein